MKTTFNYDHYYDYEKMTNCLKQLQQAYPSLMTLQSLYVTEQNKHVWAVTVTDKSAGLHEEKPAYYVDGNHHAGELMGSMAAMHLIDYLVSNYQNCEDIQTLLKKVTVYVIPKMSPDGADVFMDTPNSLRSVNRAYPKQNLEDGLHPVDLDGDGVIRLMRFESPYGSWKTSTTDSRLVVKRQPDDVEGPFYFIYPEGEIQNYDGMTIKVAPSQWGLDFNRNYPFGWFAEYRQPGSGAYPLSNPENKAIADFIMNHPNIGGASTLHTSGGMIVYPPGVHKEKEADQFDMMLYQTLGKMGTQETGYPCYNIFDAFLTDTVNYSSGAFDDWCYFTQGILTYTIEFWDLLKEAGFDHVLPVNRSKDEATLGQQYEQQIKWLDEHADELDQFKVWTPFDHPQLGMVEIGGLNFKYTVQNCPPKFLKSEIEKNTKFMIRFAKALPQLKIEKTDVKKISQDLYEINLVIGNTGYLPTYICEQAKVAKVDQPIKIVCSGATEIVGSETCQIIGHLEGFSGVEATYGYGGIETNIKNAQRKKVTYYIKGNPKDEVTFTVSGIKAGIVTTSVTLN